MGSWVSLSSLLTTTAVKLIYMTHAQMFKFHFLYFLSLPGKFQTVALISCLNEDGIWQHGQRILGYSLFIADQN